VESKGLTAEQLGGANVSGALLPSHIKGFEEPLGQVAEGSKNARKLFLILLVGCVYSLLTIATTTDVFLLSSSSSSVLPLIRTPIPTVGFYIAGPLFLVGVYCYFQICLQRLWEALADLPAVFPDGRRLCDRAYPWLLNRLVCNYFPRLRDRPERLGVLQTVLCVLLAWWAVPLTVLVYWFRYLTRQHWPITWIHIVLLVMLFWGATNSFKLAGLTLRGEAPRSFFNKGGWRKFHVYKHCLTCLAIGGFFSLASLGVINGSRCYTTLRLSNAVPFVLGFFGYDPFADFVEADISVKPLNWTGVDPKQINLVKGARLGKSSLRHAKANRVFLVKADLREADLTGADLFEANLAGANLLGANLAEAQLVGANLAGADLGGASLPGANLGAANLAGADLFGANLTRADLSVANFAGARLLDASLVGVNLSGANLFKADLALADLSDANLGGAGLIDARLVDANLFKANLSKANFSGADLSRAYLYCAKLRNIKNWKSIGDLTLANVFGVKDAPVGFSDWATKQMGAVSVESREEWLGLLRQEAKKSKAKVGKSEPAD
jgi:uncharacterized protein YjbI with pentapeptide repeats